MAKDEKVNLLRRFMLVLEYDGTRYSGWQKQKDARTIQGTLLEAAAQIFPQPVDIQGNGRTDAGVHALYYVAHLEAQTNLKPDTIRMRLNDLLPVDIVVLAVEKCHPRFHARHSCIGRSYMYRISRRKTAFAKKYVWWVKDKLDLASMREAAAQFEGMHDFAAFAEFAELKKSTRVLLNSVRLDEEDDMIIFRVIGSHFLWKMIRRMAGVLVEVGRHNLTPSNVQEFPSHPAPDSIRFTAPPSGLFFEHAFYNQEHFEDFLAGIEEVS